jgi:GxxExxY protein
MMLTVKSDVPGETEDLAKRVIGCCIDVHRVLGPGLLETIYTRAVCIELDHAGIKYQREKQVPVVYREQLLCQQRLDIVVAEQLILEIKSVEHLNPVHRAQLVTYLRLTQIRLGLLMNFNVAILQDGIKRVVL